MKNKLILKLNQAVELASCYSGGYSDSFDDAQEFYKALKLSTEKLSKGDNSVIKDIHLWFMPTSDWDDLIGREGINLANEILELIDTYTKENEKA